MKHKSLAGRFALAAAIAGAVSVPPAQAGIPVVDGTNLIQNVVTAAQQVAQTLKQIDQYQKQLEQYQNQLQNTMAPAQNIWNQAQTTISNLQNATNTLNYYKNQLGSLSAYIGKFQDVAYYRTSPCFTSAGCTPAQLQALMQNRTLAGEAQKKANDAMFQGLDLQQQNLQNDTAKLENLQTAAKTADGQLAAIGYANQLAANQSHQLLQLRALLMAQQNAVATQMQAQADKDAQTQAADEGFRRGSFHSSTPTTW
jgi:P-type conjugative transfer protein TrbJ